MKETKVKDPSGNSKPYSLHPLKPDDALRKLFAAPPPAEEPKPKKKKPRPKS